MLRNINGNSRIAVYVTAAMLIVILIIRLVSRVLIGTDDEILTNLTLTLITLFTGSIALDRATSHQSNATKEKQQDDKIKDIRNGTTES